MLPGDIVVADSEGVIVIPLRNLDVALSSVREKAHSETLMPVPGSREEYAAFSRGDLPTTPDLKSSIPLGRRVMVSGRPNGTVL